jgi:hypothetical protein
MLELRIYRTKIIQENKVIEELVAIIEMLMFSTLSMREIKKIYTFNNQINKLSSGIETLRILSRALSLIQIKRSNQ